MPIARADAGALMQSDEVRAQLRRRWLILLPAIFVTYSLAYLDRANYGFGAAAGLAETLHITGSQSALLGALFFLGYFLFQVPGASFARRRSTRWLVFFSLISWGVLASLTGMIRSFRWLAVDRLLLGVAESFILPSMLVLLTNWFARPERSRTNTILIIGNPMTVLWMSAVTGYLIKEWGWQKAFIVEGLPSIAWAFLWLAIVRDKPEQVGWLGEESCRVLERELEREQDALPKVENFFAALRNGRVIWISVQYFFWSVGVYGFVLWLPTMVQRGAKQGIGITGLLSGAPYLLAVIAMLFVSHFSDRSVRRLRFVWPSLLLGGAALFGSYLTAPRTFWWAYFFLLIAGVGMYASYGPFFAIVPEILPKNVAAEVMALVNSCGALGAFFGSWFVGVLQARTGNSQASFLLMASSLIIAALIILGMEFVDRPRDGTTLSRRRQ